MCSLPRWVVAISELGLDPGWASLLVGGLFALIAGGLVLAGAGR